MNLEDGPSSRDVELAKTRSHSELEARVPLLETLQGTDPMDPYVVEAVQASASAGSRVDLSSRASCLRPSSRTTCGRKAKCLASLAIEA